MLADTPTTVQITINATDAAALMTANPVSVRAFQTVQEAATLLTDKRITAVPVVDAEGHPKGVLSQTDIVRYEREKVDYLSPLPSYYEKTDLALSSGEVLFDGFQLQKADMTRVSEIMTPVVFSVTPDASVSKVIEEMLKHKIHRLFVVDAQGILVGVISSFDILKHLQF